MSASPHAIIWYKVAGCRQNVMQRRMQASALSRYALGKGETTMNCPICGGETGSGILSSSGLGFQPLILTFTPSEEVGKSVFQQKNYSVPSFTFSRTPAFFCKKCMKVYPVIDMGGEVSV